MKPYLIIPFLFFINAALFSQNAEIEKLNAQIKNSVFKKPDSAKIYLFRLLKHSNELADTTVAKAYSKLGISYNQLSVYDSSEYYFKKGIILTEGYPLQQAGIYSNLAINYRTNAEYSKSIDALGKAMELYKIAGDLAGEGVVYAELASNYSYMLKKEKAISHLKRAIEIFKSTEDPRLYVIQQKLANAYFNNENYEFAVDLFEQVLPKFAENKGTSYYLALPAYAESLIHLGRIEEGEDILLEAKAGLKEVNNKEYMNMVLGKLGVLYSETNRPEQAATALHDAYEYLRDIHSTRFLEIARQYLKFLNRHDEENKAMQVIHEVHKTTDDFKFKMNVDDELNFLTEARETYRKKRLFDQALTAFYRIDFLKDSLKTSVDQIKIKELEESYQNDIQREKNLALSQQNELLKENSKKQQHIILLIVVAVILLAIVLFVIYKSAKKRLAYEKNSVQQLQETNRVLSKNRQLERELLEEKDNTLIIKERELVDMSMEIADIQNQIKGLIDASGNKEISPQLADQIVAILSQKNYWKYFKSKFVEVHPDFAINLADMYTELSENDIAFCSLLKLQLSSKEIATLMGISEADVASKKHLIMAKMHLNDDEEGFDKLMQEL